jgi:tetratricopeptide (TPR) repeat protein
MYSNNLLENAIRRAMEGSFEEAEKSFTLLAAQEPSLRPQIYCERARMEVRRGNTNRALELIDLADELAPDSAEILFEKGVILFHAGKKGLALLFMDRAVGIEPENPYRYSGRAYIRDGLGDIHGAIADYETALRLDPEDSVSHNNLGLLQEKLGWKEKADRHYRHADRLSDDQELFSFIIDGRKQSGKESESGKPRESERERENESERERESESGDLGMFSVMKKVFTDGDTRRDFFQFLKDGFGLKRNSRK